MTMFRTSLVSLAAALLLATAARADDLFDTRPFARPGAYLGAGFVYGFENLDLSDVEDFSGFSVDATGSVGGTFRAGYRLHPHVALEAQVHYFDEFEIEAEGTTVISAWALAFGANLKGYVLTDRIQPYGLFGAGGTHAEIEDEFFGDTEDDTIFSLRFGGGVDCYLTENIVLAAEAGYLLGINDLDFGGPATVGVGVIPVSVELQFRF